MLSELWIVIDNMQFQDGADKPVIVQHSVPCMSGNKNILNVLLMDNDIIYDMPQFGPGAHPDSLAFICYHEYCVGDDEVMLCIFT